MKKVIKFKENKKYEYNTLIFKNRCENIIYYLIDLKKQNVKLHLNKESFPTDYWMFSLKEKFVMSKFKELSDNYE